jgi:histidyl-tRNA synthetase
MQRLPGFRDFYPADCAYRNYIFERWRQVARTFGFQEYDGPILEPTDLYRKKSGEELKTQLFRFVDQGKRDVCLRPEMTPTVARLVVERERDFKKPIKWFSIAPFFRFEKPQKGRLREFFQINCDIFGDNSAAADAELIWLAVELMCAFGFTKEDFSVRLNDRRLWAHFLAEREIPAERLNEFLAIIDKLERESEEILGSRLSEFGLDLATVRNFIATPASKLPGFGPLFEELRLRGLEEFVELDLTIVRGLDYYTGLVFELFDRKRENRALCGGGRYDNLVNAISDGAVDLPAAGFAIGDVVVGDLIAAAPHARERAEAHQRAAQLQVYLIVADEGKRPEAVELARLLRGRAISTDFAHIPTKVAKQFQYAEAVGARFALIIGQEWPEVKLKNLADRSERLVSQEEALSILTAGS